MKANYLYFVAYFPAISLICSLVSFFGAIPEDYRFRKKRQIGRSVSHAPTLGLFNPMALDRSFEPMDFKGSDRRRLQDIPSALAKFDVTALPANSHAQFVAYYFGVEKLAKAIVGIN